MTPKKDSIQCPRCGKKGTWTEDNASRPFCTERCKLIDLGAWASEEYTIPTEDSPSQDGEHKE